MSAIEDLASYIHARTPSETPEGERTTWDELTEQQRDIYRAHARNAALTFPEQYPDAATEAFAAVGPDDDLITRAKYCRRYGDWDRMKAELLAEVEKWKGQCDAVRYELSQLLEVHAKARAEVERLRGALGECVAFWRERYNEGAPHECGDYNTALWDCICNIEAVLRGDQ